MFSNHKLGGTEATLLTKWQLRVVLHTKGLDISQACEFINETTALEVIETARLLDNVPPIDHTIFVLRQHLRTLHSALVEFVASLAAASKLQEQLTY